MDRRHHYRETDTFPWWVHLILWASIGICAASALSGLPGPGGGVGTGEGLSLLGIAVVIPVLFYGLLGFLVLRLSHEAVILSWGLAGVIRKTVPYAKIRKMEPTTYRPIAEFGGWGIRFRPGKKRAWTVRGNQALILYLYDGTELYVGTRHPARLEERIRSAMSIKRPAK